MYRCRNCRVLPALLLLAPLGLSAAVPERIEVARFSAGELEGWQTEVFAGETRYEIVEKRDKHVLRARSDGTASGLYREIRVDLDQTPILNWSWKVDGILDDNDERTRAGDDYPARIYVVFSGGLLFWRTRAVNYVWSSHQPVGSEWPNAFIANARMMAVDSGDGKTGEWVTHSRNVREDYRRLFGSDPGRVDAIAIMTDTDNTGQSATAWYGDIWFSPE